MRFCQLNIISAYLIALAVVLTVSRMGMASTTLPNIVLLYADDMGWNGPSCYDNDYHETPNIDQLCAEGMKFTTAYSGGPVCAPSRACLMSGQYVTRHGVYRVNQVDRLYPEARQTIPPQNITDLPLEISTMADQLRQAGYTTGYCGKWHLGSEEEYLPSQRGFTNALLTRSPSGAKRYFFPNFKTEPQIDIEAGTYLTEVITDWTLEFLTDHSNEPFFLYVPHFNVHGPHEAREELIKYFQRKDPTKSRLDAIYAAMHKHLDDSVGRVMDKLRELGIDDNTIVVFTSDNGALKKFLHGALRGGKGMLYEGGIRVPMIVWWPDVVSPGTSSEQPVHQVDLLPTFLSIAGADSHPQQICDGVDLTPVLKSGGSQQLTRDTLYWHFPTYIKFNQGRKTYDITPCSAIRSKNWKLIEYFTSDRPENKRVFLYDLDQDPLEEKNLAKKQSEVASKLLGQLHAWRAETNAMMPHPR